MRKHLLVSFLLLVILILGNEITGKRYALVAGSTAEAQSVVEPELPRVLVDTTYQTPGGNIIHVPASGNLQSVLNSANPGDVIVLQAGATYVAPYDGLVLPPKSGDGWITIRTSNLEGIPAEGSRVDPSLHASAMPKIVSRDTGPAIVAAARVGEMAPHHYRFIGIEVTFASNITMSYGLLKLGDHLQSSLEQVPHHFIFDRCYVHGRPDATLMRGVSLNSAHTAIINSYISECHGIGFDTQAIAGWNGPGPFKIVNNYLEGAGENVLFGGADPRIRDLVPSDIEFRRNHCFKPLSWKSDEPGYAGRRWSVKNLFELKNARRVLIEGNLFENNWVDGQNGTAILFTVRNQEGGSPWSVVEDVTFVNNILSHSAAGFLILGHDYNFPSQQTRRILIKNNLFDDIGATRWGINGRLYDLQGGTPEPGPVDVRIDHNTAFHTGNVVVAGEHTGSTPAFSTKPGFVYTNNLTSHNQYGVIGANCGTGLPTLNNYFPGYTFRRNVLAGGAASVYPPDNFFPPSLDSVGFVDRAGGNYRLSAASPYKNAGTDGRDLGANIDAIQAAMSSSSQPPLNRPPVITLTATPIAGTAPLQVAFNVNASDPDGQVTGYSLDCGDGDTASSPVHTHTYVRAGEFNVRITVTDNQGATATASTVVFVSSSAPPPPPVVLPDVVLYPAQASVKAGGWRVISDAAAAGGASLHHPDGGGVKVLQASGAPTSYFDMRFVAEAGRAYRVWLRGKAQNDSPYNDSVWVQFSDSVTSSGQPVYRLGTNSGSAINLEDCSGCGLQGWGWQDNGWGVGVLGPVIYFANSGVHTLRVQTREDGISIDQVVLSPGNYLNAAPGALRNDSTILPQASGLQAPQVTIAASALIGTAPLPVNFTANASDPDGQVVAYNWSFGDGGTSTQAQPSHVYQWAGTYTAELIVTDNTGATARASVIIVIASSVELPSVKVLTPNTRVVMRMGSTYNITWSVTAAAGLRRQEVHYSLDNGQTWRPIFLELVGPITSYSWRVPKVSTQNGRIRVVAFYTGGASVEDVNDASFVITK